MRAPAPRRCPEPPKVVGRRARRPWPRPWSPPPITAVAGSWAVRAGSPEPESPYVWPDTYVLIADCARILGEPAGIRTQDTRIKSPGRADRCRPMRAACRWRKRVPPTDRPVPTAVIGATDDASSDAAMARRPIRSATSQGLSEPAAARSQLNHPDLEHLRACPGGAEAGGGAGDGRGAGRVVTTIIAG